MDEKRNAGGKSLLHERTTMVSSLTYNENSIHKNNRTFDAAKFLLKEGCQNISGNSEFYYYI